MMNVTNLKLLADYLLALPEDYRHFDMRDWHKAYSYPLSAYLEETSHCNTAGCAVGHAPYVKGLPKPYDYEHWDEYSGRIFGMGRDSDEWYWCFGSAWEDVDNTPHGAAKRILQLISTGLPEDAEAQMDGVAPLSY